MAHVHALAHGAFFFFGCSDSFCSKPCVHVCGSSEDLRYGSGHSISRTRSWEVFLPALAICSLLRYRLCNFCNTTSNEQARQPGRLCRYLFHTQTWLARPVAAFDRASELFFDNIFQDAVIKTQLGIHMLQPPVFFF